MQVTQLWSDIHSPSQYCKPQIVFLVHILFLFQTQVDHHMSVFAFGLRFHKSWSKILHPSSWCIHNPRRTIKVIKNYTSYVVQLIGKGDFVMLDNLKHNIRPHICERKWQNNAFFRALKLKLDLQIFCSINSNLTYMLIIHGEPHSILLLI